MNEYFSIRFLLQPYEDQTLDDAAIIETHLAGDVDGSVATFALWKRANYKRQWWEGIRRTLLGAPKSCLMLNVGDQTSVGKCWRIYRVNDQAIFHQALILPEVVPFSIANPYAQIPEHLAVNDDGEAISEWVVSLPALAECLAHWEMEDHHE